MNKNLFEEYTDFIFFAALNKCGNAEQAGDLAQDTFLAALSFIHKGGQADNPKAWLTAVLNRKYYDMLRRKYRKPVVCMDDISGFISEYYPDEEVIKSEEAESLRRTIAYLSKLYRDVVVMYYLHNKSVEQISRELCIPEGTVKSRLSKGREKIRRGIEDMENYSNLSYTPKTLHVSNSGNHGLDGEPYSLVYNDLLTQNILIAAYDEMLTEGEISKKIGVPAAYVEQKVNMLLKNELMVKSGNKVYTDFIIYKPGYDKDYHDEQKTFVSENMENIWNPLREGLEKIRDAKVYQTLSEKQKNSVECFFTMKCLDYGFFNAGVNVYGRQIFKDRPNGGKWIALGYMREDKPESIVSKKREDNIIYSYSGERNYWFDNYLKTKQLSAHLYSTVFGPLTDYSLYGKRPESLNHKMEEEDIVKLLYILNEGIELSDAGFNTAFLENIPQITKMGLLEKNGDKFDINVPVLIKDEGDNLNSIIWNTVDRFKIDNTEALSKYLKGKNIILPKHLTSVPGQKQYSQAFGDMIMMTVYKAKDLGYILKDVDYYCPAMVVVFEK